ncbi:hypothetical protein C8Q72DRAFT_901760 [Fomitopsis betulina]|nr:hypothetical protein C8Q72DRAFT_901760 [Fomitopsis betulina]
MADCNCTTIPSTIAQVSGPILIGSQLNWALYGVLSVQLYIYYQTGFSDSRCLTSLVCFVFIFETIQTILLTHDTFHKLAISFGDYQGLLNPYYIWFDLPVQSAILSSITQCFYAWRIKVLSNSRIVALSIVVLSILQCAGGISEGVACFRYKSTSAALPLETKSVAIWIGGSVACDITITIFMVYFVPNAAKDRSMPMVNRLIQVIVETGMATSTLAIIQISMYLGSKNTNYFITPACVLPKAYSNSFMVLLNNRGALRQTKECISLHATTPQLPGRGTAPQAHRPIQVNIDEETFIDGEHSATTTVDYTTANSKEMAPTKL